MLQKDAMILEEKLADSEDEKLRLADQITQVPNQYIVSNYEILGVEAPQFLQRENAQCTSYENYILAMRASVPTQ